MRKRKDLSKERERYWREMMERWRDSGKSIRGFCGEEGVSEWSFYRWRRRLEEEEGETPRFLPVEVVDLESEEAGKGEGESGVELVLESGGIVRVARGFDEETLRRLVGVLGGAGC